MAEMSGKCKIEWEAIARKFEDIRKALTAASEILLAEENCDLLEAAQEEASNLEIEIDNDLQDAQGELGELEEGVDEDDQ